MAKGSASHSRYRAVAGEASDPEDSLHQQTTSSGTLHCCSVIVSERGLCEVRVCCERECCESAEVKWVLTSEVCYSTLSHHTQHTVSQCSVCHSQCSERHCDQHNRLGNHRLQSELFEDLHQHSTGHLRMTAHTPLITHLLVFLTSRSLSSTSSLSSATSPSLFYLPPSLLPPPLSLPPPSLFHISD